MSGDPYDYYDDYEPDYREAFYQEFSRESLASYFLDNPLLHRPAIGALTRARRYVLSDPSVAYPYLTSGPFARARSRSFASSMRRLLRMRGAIGMQSETAPMRRRNPGSSLGDTSLQSSRSSAYRSPTPGCKRCSRRRSIASGHSTNATFGC